MTRKARAVGFNHVALIVGDIDEALKFYGRLFDFTLREREADAAFIDLGDQFLALQKGDGRTRDDGHQWPGSFQRAPFLSGVGLSMGRR